MRIFLKYSKIRLEENTRTRKTLRFSMAFVVQPFVALAHKNHGLVKSYQKLFFPSTVRTTMQRLSAVRQRSYPFSMARRLLLSNDALLCPYCCSLFPKLAKSATAAAALQVNLAPKYSKDSRKGPLCCKWHVLKERREKRGSQREIAMQQQQQSEKIQ